MIDLMRVDIESINSSQPRSSFNESDLERVADRILESEGIVKPLVLKKVGFEKYEIVDGHFEYYAALRASEKNPHVSEVNSLIISPENEEEIVRQVKALKEIELPSRNGGIQPEVNSSFNSRISNIELRLEKQKNEIREQILNDEIKPIKEQIKELYDFLPKENKKKDPLEMLNTLSEHELSVKLQRSRISGADKKAKAIVDAREKKGNNRFESYTDLVKSVKGLGEKTLLTIIDDWSRG